MRKNILLTGMPGSGKSTLLQKVIIPYTHRTGFVTKEMREAGERTGFVMETSRGETTVIAKAGVEGSFQVSRYGVLANEFEKTLPSVQDFAPEDLLFIDEIGQMQLHSAVFQSLVSKYLDEENTCIATLSQVYHNAFTDALRLRKDIIVVTITPSTRQEAEEFVTVLLRKIEKAKKYAQEPERFFMDDKKARMVSTHATRELVKTARGWECSCDFYQKHKICSHVLAVEVFDQ